MTRDEQLELVARNIGEINEAVQMVGLSSSGVTIMSGLVSESRAVSWLNGIVSLQPNTFTRSEVEAKQREITREPDDKDAPDWAYFKGQCPNGFWEWYEEEPVPDDSKGYFIHHKRGVFSGCKGEVIGDWRTTLKQVKREEKEMENVEFVHGGRYQHKFGDIGKFIGIDPENDKVGVFLMESDCDLCTYNGLLLSQMKPEPSDRDEFIEAAKKLDCHPQEGMLSRHDFCGAIFDAIAEGRLKSPEVK